MRLSKFALFAALISPGLVATAFAQHGGGGHGGGGGGHAGGGGAYAVVDFPEAAVLRWWHFRGGGFRGGGGIGEAAFAVAVDFVEAVSAAATGVVFGRLRGGYGGRYYGGGWYGGSGLYLGFGGYPYYGYGYGYPYYLRIRSLRLRLRSVCLRRAYSSAPPPQQNYGYDQGYPQQGYPHSRVPQVGPPPQQQQPQSVPPPQTQPQSANQGTAGQYYLIAFTDHTIQAANAYKVEGDQLYWQDRDNREHHVPLSQVDVPFSQQINRDRHVDFQIP